MGEAGAGGSLASKTFLQQSRPKSYVKALSYCGEGGKEVEEGGGAQRWGWAGEREK